MAKAKFFHIAELVSRLEKVAEANRYDQVSRNIHAIYEQRMSKDPNQFVSAGDVRSTFSTFAGMNKESDFRDYFDDVFDGPEEIAPKKDGEGAFDRANFTDDNRVLASAITRDFAAEIKDKSLNSIRKTIESALSTPEYSYNGYVRVAGMGDSGFANWTVYFPTARGTAAVSVPVTVVDGYPHTPEKFFGMSGAEKIFPFTRDALASYAKEFTGTVRRAAETKSGLTSLGDQSILPEAYFTEAQYEMDDARESSNISATYTVPIDEDSMQTVNNVSQRIQDAINKAHQEVKQRVCEGPNNVMSVSLNISYVGAIDFEEPNTAQESASQSAVESAMASDDMDQVGEAISTIMIEPVAIAKNKFKGVIAFNVSNKNNVATVPVEVDGDKVSIASFVCGGKAKPFTTASIAEALMSQNEPESTVSTDDQDALTDAFTDSFLGANATLNELRKTIKASIYEKNLVVANACLNVIAEAHGEEATKKATADYFAWMKEASEYASKEKAGTLTHEDMRKRAAMDIDKENDPMYQNEVKIHLM